MVPLLPGGRDRVCFVLRDLHQEIQAGATASDPTQVRIGQLRRDFDVFSSGRIVTVGYGRQQTCFMKHLDPLRDEVWEIRSRDPQPAIRVFGRFALRDVFIATHMAWRSDLGDQGDVEWAREIRMCKVKWRQLFQSYEPQTGGSDLGAYFSRNVVAVGRIP
jgi:hypothetical protein